MRSSSAGLLGRVAVAAKLLTMQQLAQATRHQARVAPEKNLGDIFVELGFMNESTLARLVKLQKDVVTKARRKAAVQPKPGATAEAPRPRPAAPEPEPIELVDAVGGPGQESDGRVSRELARKATLERLAASAATPLGRLLAEAVAKGASDVHIHSGAPLRFRVRGQFEDQGDALLEPQLAEAMVLGMLTPEQRERFEQQGEIDFSYMADGIGRFRTNAYRQLRGVDAVMRAIPPRPPSLEDLRLPQALARFTNYHQGMVLITGPTGCGKSSTMAALVNLVNEERAEHIVTIEDPIEYLHPSNRCVVNQRNVGPHTGSFARALHAALREDPDVIVIGELRDFETISLAMTAAETGHFVLATLHTDNATRTINRVVGAFPPDQQDQIRSMLSESLRAVISQRLLPTVDEQGQVPALEVLIVNRAVGNLIREDKTVQLGSVMQTAGSQGMCLLDQSLARLVAEGTVAYEVAVRNAEDPKDIPRK